MTFEELQKEPFFADLHSIRIPQLLVGRVTIDGNLVTETRVTCPNCERKVWEVEIGELGTHLRGCDCLAILCLPR